jgi:hypothetical protein
LLAEGYVRASQRADAAAMHALGVDLIRHVRAALAHADGRPLTPPSPHAGARPPQTGDAFMNSKRCAMPAEITAFNPESGLSRPLCAYPRYAKYNGTGNMKDAANWKCVAP